MPTAVYVPQPKHVAITEKINWEQRYFDATKAAMQGILSNYKFDELCSEGFYKRNIAIAYADELIKCYKQTI